MVHSEKEAKIEIPGRKGKTTSHPPAREKGKKKKKRCYLGGRKVKAPTSRGRIGSPQRKQKGLIWATAKSGFCAKGSLQRKRPYLERQGKEERALRTVNPGRVLIIQRKEEKRRE